MTRQVALVREACFQCNLCDGKFTGHEQIFRTIEPALNDVLVQWNAS